MFSSITCRDLFHRVLPPALVILFQIVLCSSYFKYFHNYTSPTSSDLIFPFCLLLSSSLHSLLIIFHPFCLTFLLPTNNFWLISLSYLSNSSSYLFSDQSIILLLQCLHPLLQFFSPSQPIFSSSSSDAAAAVIGGPASPLSVQVSDINKNYVLLTWKPPSADGTSRVEGYYVERWSTWFHKLSVITFLQ